MSKKQLFMLASCVLIAAMVLCALGPAPAADRPGPTVKPRRPRLPGNARKEARPGHRGPWLSHRRQLSAEETEEIMAFIKEYAPRAYEPLKQLLETNPRRAQPLLRRMYRLYLRVQAYPPTVRAAAVNSHMLNLPIFKALGDLRRAKDPQEKKRLGDHLRELVAQRFDHDQVVREYEVERLEKRLADFKAEVERRRKNRQRIIDKIIREMLESPAPAAPARRRRPGE